MLLIILVGLPAKGKETSKGKKALHLQVIILKKFL